MATIIKYNNIILPVGTTPANALHWDEEDLIARTISKYSDSITTTIGSYAFGGCKNLSQVYFTSCTYIDNYAFTSCYNLLKVYILGSTVPTLASTRAFYSTPISDYTTSTSGVYGSIFVKASLLTAFKTAAN